MFCSMQEAPPSSRVLSGQAEILRGKDGWRLAASA
jgi:hypothetical protein